MQDSFFKFSLFYFKIKYHLHKIWGRSRLIQKSMWQIHLITLKNIIY